MRGSELGRIDGRCEISASVLHKTLEDSFARLSHNEMLNAAPSRYDGELLTVVLDTMLSEVLCGASHTHMMPSYEPETIRELSGKNATELT